MRAADAAPRAGDDRDLAPQVGHEVELM
jgi:hypothetical protein